MVYIQVNEEQDRLLNEAISNVKNQSIQMRSCFDRSKLMDGLKFCSTMLNELRTSELTPKNYYALYMSVVDELRYLEEFLMDEVKKNIKITDIYELVQYAGNIIPRLYLLITVGIVYIKTISPETDMPLPQAVINKRAEIIKDLVEMCRGVQHPLRGLFLRYYLLQSLRSILPDNKPLLDYKREINEKLDGIMDGNEVIMGDHSNLQTPNKNINGYEQNNGDREMMIKCESTENNPVYDENDQNKTSLNNGGDHGNTIKVIDYGEEDSNRHLKSFDPRLPTYQQRLNLNISNSTIPSTTTATTICGYYGTPTIGSGFIPHASCVLDSIDFLLLNFGEMNKLWVRMQHLGHSKDREKREAERRDLRLLVGTNLVRLSELDNVGIEEFKKMILPGILEQVISCRDVIAQEYIMECIIQVFPDDFHLVTLTTFLKACAQLNPDVKIKNIMISLINRLTAYAQKEGPNSLNLESNIKLFDVFSDQISNIIQSKSSVISPEDIVSLQNCLINLALTCYTQNLEYVDRCLETTVHLFEKMNITKIHHGSPLAKELSRTVRIIMERYAEIEDLLRITRLAYLPGLMNLFDRTTSYDICGYLLLKFLEKGTPIQENKQVNEVLALLKPLLLPPKPTDQDIDVTDEIDAQIEFAKLINLINHVDCDQHFLLLKNVYGHLDKLPQLKIKYSVPTIVFGCLKICDKILRDTTLYDSQSDRVKFVCKKLLAIVKFVHEAIFLVSEKELHETGLRLYLQASRTIDTIVSYAKTHFIQIECKEDNEFNLKSTIDEFESIAYEFISQCFSIYEDDIADSKTLLTCLNVIVATFYELTCFTAENHESLRRQSFSSASKLLKKPDQARALCFIAYIFWSPYVSMENNDYKQAHDGDKVMNCLNKAVKITNQCLNNDVKLQLFTDILTTSFDLQKEHCTEITDKYIEDLIAKINKDLIGSTPDEGKIVSSDDKERLSSVIVKQYKIVESMIKDKTYLSHQLQHIKI